MSTPRREPAGSRGRAVVPDPWPPAAGGLAGSASIGRGGTGTAGTARWSRRILALVESVADPGRFTRGSRYARSRAVAGLHVGPGVLSARVAGGHASTYEVRLHGSPPAVDWEDVLWALVDRPEAAHAVLGGELPGEAAEALAEADVDLVPEEDFDPVLWWCSCPDPDDACKHVIAVWHVFAALVDDDPLVLLAWRGAEPDRFVDRLAEVVEQVGDVDVPAGPGPGDPFDLAAFWAAGPLPEDVGSQVGTPGHLSSRPGDGPGPRERAADGRAATADDPGALLHTAGPSPLSVRRRPVTELLAPAYARMATHAAKLLAEEPGQQDDANPGRAAPELGGSSPARTPRNT